MACAAAAIAAPGGERLIVARWPARCASPGSEMAGKIVWDTSVAARRRPIAPAPSSRAKTY